MDICQSSLTGINKFFIQITQPVISEHWLSTFVLWYDWATRGIASLDRAIGPGLQIL